MLFLAGLPIGRYAVLAGAAAAALAAAILLGKGYVIHRLTSFMDPFADPYGSGFQLTQSLIAIGRGGWLGVGLGEGVQKLFYLPEAHTDFLFAVLAEELGLAGTLTVVGLYTFIVLRSLAIGRKAEATGAWFAAYAAYGIGLLLGVHAFVNIGVNIGLLPTKGLTLPLMSYGGSNLVASAAGIGILLRIDHERRMAGRGTAPSGGRAVRGAVVRGRVMTRLLVVAAGTGGHVYPALAVAGRLRSMGVDVSWLGTAVGIESRLVPAAGFPLHVSRVAGLRGKGAARWLAAPLLLVRSALRALAVLARVRPHVVLGMGGYGAGPGGLVARALGVPLVVHEQNAVPGLTNRILARLATRVLEAFPASFPARRRAIHTGNPVREALVHGPAPETRLAGRRGRLRMLVVGGSQGAHALNEAAPRALAIDALGAGVAVRHQCGPTHLEATRARYAAAGVEAEVTGYIEDMGAAWAWADVAVCRAGAMTVAELAAVGVASILVPFPHATDDHQSRNARHLADRGAAVLLAQDRLDAASLAGVLRSLQGDRDRVVAMSRAAYDAAVRDATQRVADQCLEVARG